MWAQRLPDVLTFDIACKMLKWLTDEGKVHPPAYARMIDWV